MVGRMHLVRGIAAGGSASVRRRAAEAPPRSDRSLCGLLPPVQAPSAMGALF